MGLTVLPVDVNASAREYTGVGSEVRMGLMQIKGLHADAVRALLEARERGGAFMSFEDLRQRVKLDPSDAERLVKAGACDSIARVRPRAELLWELYLEEAAPRATGTEDLFALPAVAAPRAEPYDRDTMLRHEIETLGFLVSEHPLTPYREVARRRGAIEGRDLDRHAGRRVTLLG